MWFGVRYIPENVHWRVCSISGTRGAHVMMGVCSHGREGGGNHRNGMYVEKCSIYHTRWFELNRDRDANVTASRSRSRSSREPQDSHTLNPKTTITVDLSAGTDKPSVIETTPRKPTLS